MTKIKRKNRSTFARTKKELEAEFGGSKNKGLRKKILKVRVKKIKNKKPVTTVKRSKKELEKEEELVHEAKEFYWQAEREKMMVMWSGVTFFMLLIVFFWFYNLKQVIENNHLKRADNVSLEEITGNMGDKFVQMKNEMTRIKEFANKANLENKATNTPETVLEAKEDKITATTAPIVGLPLSLEATSSLFVNKENLEKLKEKIKDKVK
jgi:hypothetical protein